MEVKCFWVVDFVIEHESNEYFPRYTSEKEAVAKAEEFARLYPGYGIVILKTTAAFHTMPPPVVPLPIVQRTPLGE